MPSSRKNFRKRHFKIDLNIPPAFRFCSTSRTPRSSEHILKHIAEIKISESTKTLASEVKSRETESPLPLAAAGTSALEYRAELVILLPLCVVPEYLIGLINLLKTLL